MVAWASRPCFLRKKTRARRPRHLKNLKLTADPTPLQIDWWPLFQFSNDKSNKSKLSEKARSSRQTTGTNSPSFPENRETVDFSTPLKLLQFVSFCCIGRANCVEIEPRGCDAEVGRTDPRRIDFRRSAFHSKATRAIIAVRFGESNRYPRVPRCGPHFWKEFLCHSAVPRRS